MKKPRVRIESTASPGMVPRRGISQFGGRREGREEEGEEQEEEDAIRDKLTDAQRACVRLCMALLGQAVNRHEYESPFTCAMVILGIQSAGWKGPDQYPPILSAMIKVNRFMVMQQAQGIRGLDVSSTFMR